MLMHGYQQGVQTRDRQRELKIKSVVCCCGNLVKRTNSAVAKNVCANGSKNAVTTNAIDGRKPSNQAQDQDMNEA